MSSSYVRTQIKDYITTNILTETLIDLTVEFDEIKDFLDYHGLDVNDSWLGIQFIGSEEFPINVGANNNSGCYRETGVVFFHITEPAIKNTAATNIISRGETLRNGLRGLRINDIIIESVSPVTTEAGATLEFEGGFTSGSFILVYKRDLNL